MALVVTTSIYLLLPIIQRVQICLGKQIPNYMPDIVSHIGVGFDVRVEPFFKSFQFADVSQIIKGPKGFRTDGAVFVGEQRANSSEGLFSAIIRAKAS